MSAESVGQVQKKRLMLPWRSPKFGETLYLALVKLVIFHKAHVATRARVTKVWEEVARDFWKQPEVDTEKYGMVSVKQLRNIYNNLIARRGERFRQEATSSDPTIGDGDLSPLDQRIKEIVMDEDNIAADKVEKKRKAREIVEETDENFRSSAPSSISPGNTSNNLGTLNTQLISALYQKLRERNTVNTSQVEELLHDKLGADIDAQQALEEKLGVENAEFVIKTITLPVVIAVFCEPDHAFKMEYFKEQMIGCGLTLLDALKLHTVLKQYKDDLASD